MAAKTQNLALRSHIPQTDSLVLGGGHEAGAAVRPVKGLDGAAMANEGIPSLQLRPHQGEELGKAQDHIHLGASGVGGAKKHALRHSRERREGGLRM